MLDMLYSIAPQLPDCAYFDLKPEYLAADIDKLDAFLYKKINNAVYRCVSPNHS
jgi:glutathionyl-hydroquinone reductase